MEQNPDKEMQELMEEIAEDLGYASNREEEGVRSPKKRKGRGKRMPLVVGGAGIILMILLSSLFVGGRDRQSPGDSVDSLAPRLNRIEDRLSRLEKTKDQPGVEDKVNGTAPSLLEMEATINSLRDRLDKVNERADRLEQTVASLSSKLKTASVRSPAPRTSANKRYHEVRRGDTLYSIAKRYNLSVDELRHLNNMGTKALIHPGQKLAVR